MGPPVFLARTGPIVPANIPESCLYPYKRAQLQAILTQMNPNLSLRLYKANTKDVGVQVSLRLDKSVQCSLGSQTLHSSSLCDKAGLRDPTDAHKRALIHLPKDGEDRDSQKLTRPAETTQLLPAEGAEQETLPQLEEVMEEDATSLQRRKSKLVCGNKVTVHLGSFASRGTMASLYSSPPAPSSLLRSPEQ